MLRVSDPSPQEAAMTPTTSPRPVVVGYDGSDTSDAAVDWAAREAVHRGAPMVVLHAADRIAYAHDLGVGLWKPDRVHEAARAVAARGVDRARAAAPEVEADVASSLVGPALALDESSTGAAMVVVGSHGRSRVAGALLGATAYAVSGHARCPVVVVRDGRTDPPGPGRPVVVGTDGSVGADRALDAAADLAASHGAELHLVTAWTPPHPDPWDLPPVGYSSMAEAVQDRQEGAERTARDAAARVAARHPDLVVHTSTPEARPEDALEQAADDASLVVVGSRGHGALAGLMLGSSSRALLHHTSKPVMIVH
jgi:nucleotide-binding universal stress UspA family protein